MTTTNDRNKFLYDTLYASVCHHPEQIAVDCPGCSPRRTMTYSLLWRTATALARHIVRPRVRNDSIVFVLLPRLEEHLCIAEVAISIGGAAWCCADVSVPDDYLKVLIEVIYRSVCALSAYVLS
jgi:non-ribosomal peptide synthetase component F